MKYYLVNILISDMWLNNIGGLLGFITCYTSYKRINFWGAILLVWGSIYSVYIWTNIFATFCCLIIIKKYVASSLYLVCNMSFDQKSMLIKILCWILAQINFLKINISYEYFWSLFCTKIYIIYITQYVDTYLFDWLCMNEVNDSARDTCCFKWIEVEELECCIYMSIYWLHIKMNTYRITLWS